MVLVEKRVHTSKEFLQNKAFNALYALGNGVEYAVTDSPEQTDAKVMQVRDKMEDQGFCPAYVLKSNFYTAKDGSVERIDFRIRPSSKAKCQAASLKTSFTVFASETMYREIAKQLAQWFDTYYDMMLLQDNLDMLQDVFDEAAAEAELKFAIKLTAGSGIVDISDKSITLGISENILMNISNLNCFKTVLESYAVRYKSDLKTVLMQLTVPQDIVKANNYITKELGIFTRKSPKKLIRENVTRHIAYVREGVGYVDTDTYFALISKIAVTEEQAANIIAQDANAYIVANANPTTSEKADGKTKIYVAYKLSPFVEADRRISLVDVDIKSVVNIVKANTVE